MSARTMPIVQPVIWVDAAYAAEWTEARDWCHEYLKTNRTRSLEGLVDFLKSKGFEESVIQSALIMYVWEPATV